MGACLEVALRKLIDCLAAGSGAGNVVRGEEVNRVLWKLLGEGAVGVLFLGALSITMEGTGKC